jgi:hypothetical protein
VRSARDLTVAAVREIVAQSKAEDGKVSVRGFKMLVRCAAATVALV